MELEIDLIIDGTHSQEMSILIMKKVKLCSENMGNAHESKGFHHLIGWTS